MIRELWPLKVPPFDPAAELLYPAVVLSVAVYNRLPAMLRHTVGFGAFAGRYVYLTGRGWRRVEFKTAEASQPGGSDGLRSRNPLSTEGNHG